jgi:hypothetical protein
MEIILLLPPTRRPVDSSLNRLNIWHGPAAAQHDMLQRSIARVTWLVNEL